MSSDEENGTWGENFETINLTHPGDWTNRGQSMDDELGKEYILDRLYVRAIFLFLYSIVFCFCFFGNLAVVLAVTLHWRMRSITKFCLGNLAFANLCVGIFCVFQNLSTYITDSWAFGSFLCKMYHFINSLSHTASILILVMICVERYLAILHPFTCRTILTITRLRLIILGVWIISAVISAPRLYYITTYLIPTADDPDKFDMICAPEQSRYNNRTFDMIYFLLLFVLPLIVMSVLYARVGVFLWRSSPLLESAQPGRSSPESQELSQIDGSSSGYSFSSTATEPSASPNAQHRTSANTFSRFTRRFRRRQSFRRDSPSSNIRKETTQISTEFEVSMRKEGNSNSCAKIVYSSTPVPVSSTTAKKVSKFREVFNIQKRKRSKPTLRSVLKARGHQNRFNSEIRLLSKIPLSRNNSRNSQRRISIPSSQSQVIGNVSYPPNYQHKPKEAQPIQRNRSQERIVPRACTIARKKMLKPRQAVVRMLVITVITFAVCNLPFHIRKMCQNYVRGYDFGSNLSHLLTPLTFLLMYTNCAISPILYAFMSKSFRASFNDLLKCQFRSAHHRRQESFNASVRREI